MDTLTYSFTTNTHRIVELTRIGKRFRLVVYGAMFLTGVEVEWANTLAYAVQRFQFLVERNTKPAVDKSKLTFKSPETILHEKRKTSAMRDDWEEWQGGNFDLLDFY